MRIGFDFDNTIVSYDSLFHKVALEQGVIDESIPVNKIAVRDHLRKIGKEPVWTEMQGYVYGGRMAEAQAFAGVIDTIAELAEAGHTLAIMSHKTKHPYIGEQYDLHAAARNWIQGNLVKAGKHLIPEENIYFELTKEEKLARIESFKCDIFFDDLPEILLAEKFPSNTRRYLFDPESSHAQANLSGLTVISAWDGLVSQLASVR